MRHHNSETPTYIQQYVYDGTDVEAFQVMSSSRLFRQFGKYLCSCALLQQAHPQTIP